MQIYLAGPFEVVERIGEINYRVRQPGNRKLDQIYQNVKLLKRWHPRDMMLCCRTQGESNYSPQEKVKLSPDLNPQQRQEVVELVDPNKDIT